jgi:hypothetical protein
MIAPDVIRRIADEVIAQITMGCKAYRAGDVLSGELHMSLGQTALLNLQRLLDEPPAKPFRRLVVVGTAAAPHDPELLPWMETTHGDDPDAA